jgi:tetratricopeptide (TPR) repeat protein
MQTADIQVESKNYTEAEKIYRAILKEDPKHLDAQYSLGVVLRNSKNHAAAAEAFATAATLTKNEHHVAHLLYNAALEYARADRTEEASTFLAKAFAAGYPDKDVAKKVPEFAKVKVAAK